MILEQRNTPISDVGSLARLSMGRRLRSNIPCSTNQLKPNLVNPEIVQIRFEQKQAQQKRYYDRSARPLKNYPKVMMFSSKERGSGNQLLLLVKRTLPEALTSKRKMELNIGGTENTSERVTPHPTRLLRHQ